MDLSNFTVSFLTDDILRMRYVSIDGQLRKVLDGGEDAPQRSTDRHA